MPAATAAAMSITRSSIIDIGKTLMHLLAADDCPLVTRMEAMHQEQKKIIEDLRGEVGQLRREVTELRSAMEDTERGGGGGGSGSDHHKPHEAEANKVFESEDPPFMVQLEPTLRLRDVNICLTYGGDRLYRILGKLTIRQMARTTTFPGVEGLLCNVVRWAAEAKKVEPGAYTRGTANNAAGLLGGIRQLLGNESISKQLTVMKTNLKRENRRCFSKPFKDAFVYRFLGSGEAGGTMKARLDDLHKTVKNHRPQPTELGQLTLPQPLAPHPSPQPQ